MPNVVKINSIELPHRFLQKRELRRGSNHINGAPLDAEDIAQYDRSTIFYDVFFDFRNSFLYTVGPPLLNLQKSLLPVSCSINDRSGFTLNVDEYCDHQIAVGKLPVRGVKLRKENVVELHFNGSFSWKGRISIHQQERYPLILLTLQKENRIQWISEWIEFYSGRYHPDHIIIYDNESRNRIELLALEYEHLTIIPWDFKYGPTRSHQNQFCQLGAINHCRLRFGFHSRIMNFDIDELLFMTGPEFQRSIRKWDVVSFDAYRVPFIKPTREDYSYADFRYRDKELQAGGRKYVFRTDNVLVNHVHEVELARDPFRRIVEGMLYKLRRVFKEQRLWNRLLDWIGARMERQKVVPVRNGYVLHYTGITTNWKSVYWDRTVETLLSDKHTKI